MKRKVKLKKYGEAVHGFRVLENPMTEHSSSPMTTLSHFSEKSNIQVQEDVQPHHQMQNIEFVKKSERYEKILYHHANVNVNGIVRECKNGLVQGFKNAVSALDKVRSENNLLRKENENLKAIIQNNLEAGIER